MFLRTVLQNPWIRLKPTKKQAEFLLAPEYEVLYGGAAGGGKSIGLLQCALQFVDVPGYNAIIFRRTHRDHMLPGGLVPLSFEWLGDTEAKWNGADYKWTFPSGATLTFGYLETEQDKFRYQSAAFHMIGWDEVTQFYESQYRYVSFSRRRRILDFPVPLRIRAASNPPSFKDARGKIVGEWVKQRFLIEGSSAGRRFIPARLEDNPFLDCEAYDKSLKQLDRITYQQLRWGDWEVKLDSAGKFRREWFPIVDDYPKDAQKVRYWDLASTSPEGGADPDFTVGAFVAMKQGIYYVTDIRRMRGTPSQVAALLRQTAELDGHDVSIYMEQEPGASGVAMIDYYSRDVLQGFAFRPFKTTGSKEIRANPVSAAAEAGNIKLLRGPWNTDFLDEFEIFPQGSHDDQVDAVSGAFENLRVRPMGKGFILR